MRFVMLWGSGDYDGYTEHTVGVEADSKEAVHDELKSALSQYKKAEAVHEVHRQSLMPEQYQYMKVRLKAMADRSPEENEALAEFELHRAEWHEKLISLMPHFIIFGKRVNGDVEKDTKFAHFNVLEWEEYWAEISKKGA